jgi:hypothetical protein
MNYEVLVFIVLTLLLWRRVAGKANKPPGLNKKAAKQLWHSEPIEPKHEPPNVAGGNFSSHADDEDRRFFADFDEFADVVNRWLADEHVGSRWRLQALPKADLSLNVDFSSGPIVGRCYAIFYNQSHLGELEIRPAYEPPYSTETPQVCTNIEIRWVRLLGINDITDFLNVIASYVSDHRSQSDEYISARQAIQYALTNGLWDSYRISEFEDLDGQDWGELTLNFQGSASYYIQRRDRWRSRLGSR